MIWLIRADSSRLEELPKELLDPKVLADPLLEAEEELLMVLELDDPKADPELDDPKVDPTAPVAEEVCLATAFLVEAFLVDTSTAPSCFSRVWEYPIAPAW